MILQGRELAAAIRRTNARLKAAGSPDVPELDRLWIEFSAALAAAHTEAEQLEQICLWESWANLAIRKVSESRAAGPRPSESPQLDGRHPGDPCSLPGRSAEISPLGRPDFFHEQKPKTKGEK
jgi:hypothetical protein